METTKFSLRNKILLAVIVPVFLVLLAISFLSINNKRITEKQLLLDHLGSYQALLESGDLSFSTAKDKGKLENLLGEKVDVAEIYQPDYVVVYTTDQSGTADPNSDLNNIRAAFSGSPVVNDLDVSGRSSLEYIAPLTVNDNAIAVMRLVLPYEESNIRVNEYAVYNAIWALGGIIACYLLITILLERVVLRNIQKLKQGTVAIKSGHLDYQIDLVSRDELGELATSFNNMAGRLHTYTAELEKKVAERTTELEKERGSLERRVKERTAELEKIKVSLEQTVAERTKSVQEKLNEMERLNKHMIGRELKMAEMKKELEDLKNKNK